MRDITEFSDKPFSRCTECKGTGYYHPWGTDGYDPTPVRKAYVTDCECIPRTAAEEKLSAIETLMSINDRLRQEIVTANAEIIKNEAKVKAYENDLEALYNDPY